MPTTPHTPTIEHSPTAPDWQQGQLRIPAEEHASSGYGVVAADEHRAHAIWQELALIGQRNPRLTLTLGASLGSAYITPLGLRPFVWSLYGPAQQAKSTVLTAAAAVWGSPQHHRLVQLPDSTIGGLIAQLGALACVPAFFDEIAATPLFRSPDRIAQTLLTLTNGAQRTVGGSDHNPSTVGGWRSVAFLTGQNPLTSMHDNPGLRCRVLELSAPLVETREDSEAVTTLAREGYGWPLRWQQQAGMDVAGFAELIVAAQHDLALPGHPATDMPSVHCAVAVAGVTRLEALLKADGMRNNAVDLARQLLTSNHQDTS